MSYYYFTLVLFLLTAHMAAGVPADCGQTYQNTLKSLLTQKENCDTAGFKDCCQVQLSKLRARARAVERKVRGHVTPSFPPHGHNCPPLLFLIDPILT